MPGGEPSGKQVKGGMARADSRSSVAQYQRLKGHKGKCALQRVCVPAAPAVEEARGGGGCRRVAALCTSFRGGAAA